MANIAPKARERKHSIEDLRTAFECDFETGVLTWKVRPSLPKSWNTKYSGKKAGVQNSNGYRYVQIDGIKYPVHHIVWAMKNDEWANSEIDHENGVEYGDGISNIRLSTRSQNNYNRSFKVGSSGHRGVWRSRNGKKWVSSISCDGNPIHLGTFESREDAISAHEEAAKKYHGEFSYLNRKKERGLS
jgi:hypothetical protein